MRPILPCNFVSVRKRPSFPIFGADSPVDLISFPDWKAAVIFHSNSHDTTGTKTFLSILNYTRKNSGKNDRLRIVKPHRMTRCNAEIEVVVFRRLMPVISYERKKKSEKKGTKLRSLSLWPVILILCKSTADPSARTSDLFLRENRSSRLSIVIRAAFKMTFFPHL